MIRLDVSTTSVVVKCSECPHWYAFAWTREAGYTSSEQHLVAVHGVEPNQAAEARRSFLRRHADS